MNDDMEKLFFKGVYAQDDWISNKVFACHWGKLRDAFPSEFPTVSSAEQIVQRLEHVYGLERRSGKIKETVDKHLLYNEKASILKYVKTRLVFDAGDHVWHIFCNKNNIVLVTEWYVQMFGLTEVFGRGDIQNAAMTNLKLNPSVVIMPARLDAAKEAKIEIIDNAVRLLET